MNMTQETNNVPVSRLNHLFRVSIFCFVVIFSYTCCNDNDANPICQSDIFYADTCVDFSIYELLILKENDQFFITNNTSLTIEFASLSEAEMALEVIETYQLNEYCIIGRDTTFAFFLTNEEIPEGEINGEDCLLVHELCNLEVKLTWSGKYTVIEPISVGDRWLYSSESQDTANQILQTMLFYQPTYTCYVGRPKTKMMYIRK